MTGPEHYLEAERLLQDQPGRPEPASPQAIAAAQVHATLAHAAAYLDGILVHPDDRREWDRAMGRPDEVTR